MVSEMTTTHREQRKRGQGYLNAHERRMLERGVFFGGWEDADIDDVVLAPLNQFDHPALHVMRMGQPEWDPVVCMRQHMAKAMAGAPRSEQIDAATLRHALQRGRRLRRRQLRCLQEMIASCRMWEMHRPFTAWGLSMFELARVVTVNWNGEHTWASWLNLWARDPERPLPAPPRRLPWNPQTHPPFEIAQPRIPSHSQR